MSAMARLRWFALMASCGLWLATVACAGGKGTPESPQADAVVESGPSMDGPGAEAVPDADSPQDSTTDVVSDGGPDHVAVDVCVYGGTSAGVIAAYAAKARGVSVILVEPGRHLGGMSASGLGHTDVGHAGAITGLASDFYKRVGAAYGSATRVYDFEPHVAEQVFQQYAQEAGFEVLLGMRVASVSALDGRVQDVRLEASPESPANDVVVSAGVFIDASYEGDLMARAGVSYVVGRESNATYGETLNGVQLRTMHQFPDGIDPYVTPGVPSSGLLPGISPQPKEPEGSGDNKVQAYNFRLCMTTAASQIAMPAPVAYDPARYELLGRTLATHPPTSLDDLFIRSPVVVGKYDWNNRGPVSTDYIGGNWGYPDASYADRELAYVAHQQWTAGLFRFLQTDLRVPAVLRSELTAWGLCGDEFTDNGSWPHQIYVREARRMVGSMVMTEGHCTGAVKTDRAVAFGSYQMDSHNCQRVVVGGMVKNEGDVEVSVPAPYGISYDAITPKESDCTNLLVPVCLSASHIAYGSIRTEPVLMALGQAAGIAAALAITEGTSVQGVDSETLLNNTIGVVMDSELPTANGSVSLVGSWVTSSMAPGYLGGGYYHDGNTSKGSMSVTFIPALPRPGTYAAYCIWTSDANRATNVPISIHHAGQTDSAIVDQQTGGAAWHLLGEYAFSADGTEQVVIENTGTNGFVIVDAMRFEPR
jgi:hypothetical protein